MVSYRAQFSGVVERRQALWLTTWPESRQIVASNGLSRKEAKSHTKPSAKKCKTTDVKDRRSCSV
jgi:hypothetical protein